MSIPGQGSAVGRLPGTGGQLPDGTPAVERPSASIVVPVFNGAMALGACLDALSRQTYPRARFEVIVVDNGSTEDLSAVRREHPGVVWLEEAIPGSYGARNRGIAAARHEVLCFIDSDCVAAPDWLENGVRALTREPRPGVVGGRVHVTTRDPAHPTWAETFELHYAFPQKRFVEKDGFSGTGNLFTFRSVFDKVGRFRGDVKSGGDREWGNRVRDAGLRLAYASEVVVEHPARRTIRALVAKKRRTTGGQHDLNLLPASERGWMGLTKMTFWGGLFFFSSLPAIWKRHRRGGVGVVLRIYVVSCILVWATVLEIWRLRLGGTSRR